MKSVHERFQEKVAVIPFHSCHEWIGRKNHLGYGVFDLPKPLKYRRAHRMAWTLVYGDIPSGLFVCHHCDNPGCVRIDHLFLGTNADNMRDMWRKRRRLRIKDMTEGQRSAWLSVKLKYRAEYREARREELRAKGREYVKSNRDKMNAYRRLWRARRRALGLTAI